MTKEVYTETKLYEIEFRGWMPEEIADNEKRGKLLDNIVQLSYKHGKGRLDKDELADFVPALLDSAITLAKDNYIRLRIEHKITIDAYRESFHTIDEIMECVQDGDISQSKMYKIICRLYDKRKSRYE